LITLEDFVAAHALMDGHVMWMIDRGSVALPINASKGMYLTDSPATFRRSTGVSC
jgi:hypothetical protein